MVSDTVDSLVRETKCYMDHPAAASFKDNIISGDWDAAIDCLTMLEHSLKEEMQYKVSCVYARMVPLNRRKN